MSKPEIAQTIGGYSFLWPEGVNILVSRLRVHNSDGHVTGEILVKRKDKTLYPQTQINFSADRTRNALSKTLNERYKGNDWQEIIDQLGYHVQEKARQGDPVVELCTHDEIQQPEYIVDPIIMENQPNVLFGAPESGKTQFAMLLCLISELPWYDNHLGLKAPRNSCPALWLDYEADAITTKYNFTRIARGADVTGISLPYRRCRLPLADDIEALAHHIEQTKAKMIVIDSVAKAAGGDLDKSESPNRLFSALDQLHVTSLILAHTSKGGEGDSRKSIYGSVFFEAYARSVWELRSVRDGDEMTIGVWDNKANFRRKHDPMAFQLIYNHDTITVTTQDIKTVEDFMEHLSVSTQIVEALKSGSKSPKELKALLPKVSTPTFYAELARMTKRNKLVRMGEGKDALYGLAENRVQ